MNITQQISTSEFNLAAYILAKRYSLIKLSRENPRRVRFIFSDVPQTVVEDYWTNSKVNVLDLVKAQQELKQRLFADVY